MTTPLPPAPRAGRPADRTLLSRDPLLLWPALPRAAAQDRLAVLYQLEQSQWWAAEDLFAQQLHQASALFEHAWRQVPFYRERLGRAGFEPGRPVTPEIWARLPVLTRAEVQQAGPGLFAAQLPPTHGKTYELVTSGSTGRPVKTRGSYIVQLMWDALSLREHLWHRRDFAGTLAAIRSLPSGAADYPQGAAGPAWSRTLKDIFETGPACILSIASSTEQQAEWLQRTDPDYLMTYPSALRDLLLHCRARGIRLPRLREVRTLSECLPQATRELCREVWEVPVVDGYSSQEHGLLAAQCPQAEHYHVQSESVLLEVLDESGRPCGPGEVGEVVVTALHNFAMPMIRYALGDLAEVGGPCACGRGLPVLTRILGRSRDMLVYPDGRKAWPLLGTTRYVEIPEVRQFQIVQHAADDLEFKVVADRVLSAAEEARLSQWVQERCGHAFPIRFTYHDEIPRSAGGKFEEFRCEIPADPAAGRG